jgi:hypothetical protein
MDHERMKEAQDAWNALAAGDPGPAFDALSESVIVDNGPGAGPWRHIEGRDALADMLVTFSALFRHDWKQQGTVIYADEDKAIALVNETGTAKSGEVFDNLAIYVYRTGDRYACRPGMSGERVVSLLVTKAMNCSAPPRSKTSTTGSVSNVAWPPVLRSRMSS